MPASRKRAGAYLEVVSGFDSFEEEVISISVQGPSHCRGGVENLTRIRHGRFDERIQAGRAVNIPVHARLRPLERDPGQLKERFLKELAPWKWDNLEIATGTVEVESCREGNALRADLFIYPGIRCEAAGSLLWEMDRRTGEIRAHGNARVTVGYNGEEAVLGLAGLQGHLEELCPLPWGDLMALADRLRVAERLAAAEGGSHGGPPSLARFSISGSAALVEKKGSPDVHARYFFQVEADPLFALDYEFNLLPWLETGFEGWAPERPGAGLDMKSGIPTLFSLFDGGVFLLAKGSLSATMTFSGSRLANADPLVGSVSGMVCFKVEGRSAVPGRGGIIEVTAAPGGEEEAGGPVLRVSGECLCGAQPALHEWGGKAGFGGLGIHAARSQAGKVVIHSPFFEKKGCNISVLKSHVWWEPPPPG